MGVKIYKNGAWTEIEDVKEYTNGAWKSREALKAYEAGAWADKWTNTKRLDVAYVNTFGAGSSCVIVPAGSEHAEGFLINSTALGVPTVNKFAPMANGTFSNPTIEFNVRGHWQNGRLSLIGYNGAYVYVDTYVEPTSDVTFTHFSGYISGELSRVGLLVEFSREIPEMLEIADLKIDGQKYNISDALAWSR